MDKNKLTRAEKIVREIDKFLSNMSDKERKKFFKQYGIEVIEDTLDEKQHQLIRLKAALAALYVLNERQIAQEDPENQITCEDKSEQPKQENWHPLEGTEAWKMIQFMTTPSKPSFTLKGTRHIPTTSEIEAMKKANERIKEGNRRELEAKAVAEEKGIVYGNKAKETSSANERHHQLIRLKAALAALCVLNERQIAQGVPNNQITYGILPDATQTTKELSFEEIMAAMAEKDFDNGEVTIIGSHPAVEPTSEEQAEASAAGSYVKTILSQQNNTKGLACK